MLINDKCETYLRTLTQTWFRFQTIPFRKLFGDHFGVDGKKSGDHFGVGIISGSIWGSFRGRGSFRGQDHFGGCTVFANIAMPEADTNPDFKSWTGTDKITKKENGKQQNRITKTEKRITNNTPPTSVALPSF